MRLGEGSIGYKVSLSSCRRVSIVAGSCLCAVRLRFGRRNAAPAAARRRAAWQLEMVMLDVPGGILTELLKQKQYLGRNSTTAHQCDTGSLILSLLKVLRVLLSRLHAKVRAYDHG